MSLNLCNLLDNLVYLNVAGNLITRHSAIACLAMLPRLKTVYFEQIRPVVSFPASAASSSASAADRAGEMHLYTNPICRALSYGKEINDLLPNLQNLDGWPTERLEVSNDSNDGERALVSIQEAFSHLDNLVDAKKDISGDGDARGRYWEDRLCAGVKPWVDSGFWNLNGEGASGQSSDNYVDSVDKDLANVLRQCKKVCEKGKELREGVA